MRYDGGRGRGKAERRTAERRKTAGEKWRRESGAKLRKRRRE